MKTYFRFGDNIASKALVEAISSTVGVGPFAGFSSATISDDNSKLTIKAGNSSDKSSANSLLKTVFSDRILSRYITKYEAAENPDVNFGCISRDGYIYCSPNTTMELAIQGTKGSLNEVLVFAKHTKVTEPVDNPVEFEAYWNPSSISFYELYKKSTDPYYPTVSGSRSINFNDNDPLTKVVSSVDSRQLYSYEYLLSQVVSALSNYSSENMVLVGIYGTGTDVLSSTVENFAIVPYNSKWPTSIPYNQAIHLTLKESISHIETLLKGINGSIDDYISSVLETFKSSVNETIALSILPKGSIILWDGDTVPDGWEEVTAAQGKILMGYISGGISVKGQKVLTTVGSTYNPSSTQQYDFTIDASNLPKHCHSLGITQSSSQYSSASGTAYLPMVQSYGNRASGLNGTVGGDTNTTKEVQGGAIVTSFNLVSSGSYNTVASKDSLQIEKLPPTITLRFIRKIS